MLDFERKLFSKKSKIDCFKNGTHVEPNVKSELTEKVFLGKVKGQRGPKELGKWQEKKSLREQKKAQRNQPQPILSPEN
ncbi:MAG: hypothetical protein F6J87_27845 [Spirulina sp. SIO3F2]|nr:hypothetical protein [Spirulina sp. SIO3F2]